jgi:hypothetical protein
MPLQAGSWTANVGGLPSQLQITAVDAQGNVSGSIAGNPISGFWDEDSQRITFLRAPSTVSGLSLQQLFVGYLFTDPINLTGLAGSVHFTLAGYVEDFLTQAPTFIGPPPSAKRSVFGWYAQIAVD